MTGSPTGHRRARVPLRDALGLVLRELRRTQPGRGLTRCEWAVFVASACHWQGRDETWPSQETIAAFGGYMARVVPAAVAALERRGLLRVRRQVDGSGMRRIVYTPGPELLYALDAFEARYPRVAGDRSEVASVPPEVASGVPELASGVPEIPASVDQKPLPLNQETTRTNLVVAERGEEARELALAALAEHFHRGHPGLPVVRTFDEDDVAVVARCAAIVAGDRDAKHRALLDAVEGAFAASPRPPTVRFVWGRIEHFLTHADRGRRARLRRERDGGRGAPAPAPSSRIPRDQLQADLVRLFGPAWRSAR